MPTHDGTQHGVYGKSHHRCRHVRQSRWEERRDGQRHAVGTHVQCLAKHWVLESGEPCGKSSGGPA